MKDLWKGISIASIFGAIAFVATVDPFISFMICIPCVVIITLICGS